MSSKVSADTVTNARLANRNKAGSQAQKAKLTFRIILTNRCRRKVLTWKHRPLLSGSLLKTLLCPEPSASTAQVEAQNKGLRHPAIWLCAYVSDSGFKIGFTVNWLNKTNAVSKLYGSSLCVCASAVVSSLPILWISSVKRPWTVERSQTGSFSPRANRRLFDRRAGTTCREWLSSRLWSVMNIDSAQIHRGEESQPEIWLLISVASVCEKQSISHKRRRRFCS